MGVIRVKNGQRQFNRGAFQGSDGGPGPGLSLKRRPSHQDNSEAPDRVRVALKAAQSTSLRLSKRSAPSMPRMPWENE